MTDLFPDPGPDWRIKLKRVLLDLDARIDFAVYQSGKWTRELYERFTAIMDSFHVPAGGVGSSSSRCRKPRPRHGRPVCLLALAIPAFRDTSDERLAEEVELAVTFLDRYGNEIGNGYQARRLGDARGDARPSHQGGAGDRGPAFLRAFRHRLLRYVPRAHDQRQGRRRGSGRSTITQQLAKNLFLSNERTIERKINEAFLALWLETHLSKNEILKLYLDRAYLGGGAFGVNGAAQYLFRQIGARRHLAGSGDARGPVQGADKFSPLAICRRRAPAPTSCSIIWSTPAS